MELRVITTLVLALWVSGAFRHGSGASPPGFWELLVENSGVSAMHMLVSHTNKVLIFDRTDYGPSAIRLPHGRCRNDSSDLALKIDCWAHSVELQIPTRNIRPLEVLTDTWCSSGAFRADGTFTQTGGWNDGARVVRHYNFCEDCDWTEQPGGLQRPRWYASNQILPDNRVIVVGGRVAFSYEFVPGDGHLYSLPFLRSTSDGRSENNLYPFLHLLPDGNMFVFANSESILLDYKNNKVVRSYPSLPGGARNYPASGSSVMLPLLASQRFQRVEVLICGGASKTAYKQASSGSFETALKTCGRMVVTDNNPSWILEEMPLPRVMGDMLNLPTGEVLIINGAQQGTAGWRFARNPALTPLLYSPSSTSSSKFTTLASASIPRMYHSTAILLPDTRVLVAGSNPNVGYDFSEVLFPTELRIEAFSPPYLDSYFDGVRAEISSMSKVVIGYNSQITIEFSVSVLGDTEATLYAPAFATHAYSMNQRLLKLESSTPVLDENSGYYTFVVRAPPTKTIAPPGYYMLFVVNSGVPSIGKWIQML
ncbi:aldehyde oxidase GLOX [Selaginella moellendorffii]|nr:aldehyde oxidase GLOX [Selaginella moellendorffii]|eukprot:XP_002975736.2 aldehyde oxidase GLOX [Selaginella moellendorffii]